MLFNTYVTHSYNIIPFAYNLPIFIKVTLQYVSLGASTSQFLKYNNHHIKTNAKTEEYSLTSIRAVFLQAFI